MNRHLGYRGPDIVFVGDGRPCKQPGTHVIPLAKEFDGLSPTELIKNYCVRDRKIIAKNLPIPQAELKVAFISDYAINCGIATYTKYVCDQMRPLVREIRIFAERAPIENTINDPSENVVRCWDRRGDYSQIVPAVQHYDPDIIFIQHEFGLFHKLNEWNTLMSQLSRWRTITVLHTVLEHDIDNHDAKLDYLSRSFAEGACPEVIVHMQRARATMRARGYSGRVHYIPHGCFPANRVERLPVHKYGMYPEHSIFQYGFGGTHKGWEFAINTVEKLKKKYPNIIYVGVFNISPFSEDAQSRYYRELLDTIKSRGLEKNVAIHKGYQSDEMLSNFIRGSKVSFFPYQVPEPYWASWGASGAIRLPLSLGAPMALSDFPVFREFEGKLPLCRTVDDAVTLIDRIFSDPNYEKHLSETSYELADSRSWDKVARWYLNCTKTEDYNAY